MDSYRYKPLKDGRRDIRLVSIEPGEQNHDLKCSIRTHKSLRPVKYQALSYTWSDSAVKVKISLNGKRFMVTQNLESALRNLRCPGLREIRSQLPTWIDAICTNQNDTDERDEQVRRMKSIYKEAQRVVVYLGAYNESCDENVRIEMGRLGIEHLDENST
jgi:galactokinase